MRSSSFIAKLKRRKRSEVALPPDFNEELYLIANPDVKAEVLAGSFISGAEHFLKFGRQEGRTCVRKDRYSVVTRHLNLGGLGLEIGPSHNPVVPKSSGHNVHILDHLDQAGLMEKYAAHGVDVSKIEPVDFVWQGEPLSELIGIRGLYDWIIASHVIEHVPDIVSFINECAALLKEDGRLSLVVPDKRYCFDILTPLSTPGQILDAHHERRIRPTPGQVFDYFTNSVRQGDQIAWSSTQKGEIFTLHSFEEAVKFHQIACSGTQYVDVHCWRFTPESFVSMVYDLHALGVIELTVVDASPTHNHEFYVVLGRPQGVQVQDRLSRISAIAAGQ